MCQCKYASLSKAVNLKMSFHYIPAVTFSRFFSSYMLATHVNPSERQDNEIAQEIQEELVRQAERQRQQEEKDAVGSGPEAVLLVSTPQLFLVFLFWAGHSFPIIAPLFPLLFYFILFLSNWDLFFSSFFLNITMTLLINGKAEKS